MSGQAGAGFDSQLYKLLFSSSISEDVAVDDDDPGAARVDAYFAEASSPFERALAIARPALDQLFGEWAARSRVPIVPVHQKHEVIDGTLIEDLTHPDGGDLKAQSFNASRKGGAVPRRLPS